MWISATRHTHTCLFWLIIKHLRLSLNEKLVSSFLGTPESFSHLTALRAHTYTTNRTRITNHREKQNTLRCCFHHQTHTHEHVFSAPAYAKVKEVLMIGSFWNLCRACPSMPVDKVSEKSDHFHLNLFSPYGTFKNIYMTKKCC